jgi:hypothetical protein
MLVVHSLRAEARGPTAFIRTGKEGTETGVRLDNNYSRRVQKIDSTGTTNHVWDGQNILLETDASNIIQAVYALEPSIYGNLISQSGSGVDSFYLFDALGSTRQLAKSTGSVTDSYLYDCFGNILLMGTTVNPFACVGKRGYYYYPDPGTYNIRARTYPLCVGLVTAGGYYPGVGYISPQPPASAKAICVALIAAAGGQIIVGTLEPKGRLWQTSLCTSGIFRWHWSRWHRCSFFGNTLVSQRRLH